MSRFNNTDWGAVVGFTACVFIVLFCGAAVYGYVANIIAIAHSTDVLTPMFILRALGLIVVPLGVVMGFL